MVDIVPKPFRGHLCGTSPTRTGHDVRFFHCLLRRGAGIAGAPGTGLLLRRFTSAIQAAAHRYPTSFTLFAFAGSVSTAAFSTLGRGRKPLFVSFRTVCLLWWGMVIYVFIMPSVRELISDLVRALFIVMNYSETFEPAQKTLPREVYGLPRLLKATAALFGDHIVLTLGDTTVLFLTVPCHRQTVIRPLREQPGFIAV